MSLPSKALTLDEDGRLRINRAAAAMKTSQMEIEPSAPPVEIPAGLSNRRVLYIKPLQVTEDPPRRYIRVGPSTFPTVDGQLVWEGFELVLQAGHDITFFAIGDGGSGNIRISLLELGED